MTLKEEQAQFDVVKWHDSIEAGKDLCGTYEFCGFCNKKEKNPCAHAARRFRSGNIRVATTKGRKKKA